jgi:hypothetical protein
VELCPPKKQFYFFRFFLREACLLLRWAFLSGLALLCGTPAKVLFSFIPAHRFVLGPIDAAIAIPIIKVFLALLQHLFSSASLAIPSPVPSAINIVFSP